MIGEIEALLDHSVDIDRPALAGAFARVQQHVLDNCIGALAVPLVGWVAVTNFCCGYSLTLSARYVHRRPLPTGAGGRETKSSSCSRAQLPSTHVVVDSGRATHQRGSFVSARLRSASAQKQKTYVRQFTNVSLDQRNYPHERLSHRRPTCEEY